MGGSCEKWLVGTKTKERFQEQTRTQGRSEMQKPATTVRRTLLNGSAWSTERKYMRSHTSMFDICLGIVHRMRKEEMDEQLNKEVKQGWSFAAGAAMIIDESASSEVCKLSSGVESFWQLTATWER